MPRDFDPDHPELMDQATEVTPELERDLDNLVSLNARFGSHRMLRRFLSRWFNPGRCYRVLDLCTGSGDLPRVMVDWARPREITLRIDAVDSNPATIEIARRKCADYPEISCEKADVLRFHPAGSYDLVHCSLALHHFSDEDAVRLLRQIREWSDRWVLVSDLERHPITTMSVWLVTELIYRDPMTVHDARVSARRAFSYREFGELAQAAGWSGCALGRFLWSRQALWMDERTLGEVPISPVTLPTPA
jgi:SAM-dependent methyltransferase